MESDIALFLPLTKDSSPIIYNAIAASAFFMWEYCITISAEVELVWKPKWTWITSLFLVIRYLALVNVIALMIVATNVSGALHPSQRSCTAWMWFEMISVPVLLLGVEVLLIARVFAFYERNTILLTVLIVLSLCANASRLAMLGVFARGITVIQNPLPPNLPFGACIVKKMPALFSNTWIPEFIPETVLFGLVITKAVRTSLRSRGKIGASRVLVVLVRDGSWAFALIFAGTVWALLEFELTAQMGLIPLSWMVSALGFCGSRLILNLRSAAKETHRVPYYAGEAFELSYGGGACEVSESDFAQVSATLRELPVESAGRAGYVYGGARSPV